MPVVLEIFPGAGLADAPTGTVPGELQIAFYKFRLGYGVPIEFGDTKITFGVRYETLRIDLLDAGGFVLLSPDLLHYARVEVRFRQRFSQEWALAIIAMPGIASDFDEVGPDDFRFLGSILATKRLSSNLRYGFGVGISSDFGIPLVIPLAKLNWHSTGKMRLDALLPLSLYVGYESSARSELGVTVAASGTQYNINLKGEDVRVRFPDAPDEIDLPAKYSVVTVGPTYKHRLVDLLYFSAEVGLTVLRKFEFDGDVINDKLDQDPSGYIRLGLAIRSPAN